MAEVVPDGETAEPGVWRAAGGAVLAAWREQRRQNLLNTEGRRVELEFDTAHHRGWDRAATDTAGNAILESPRPEKPEEPRRTVEILTKDLVGQMLYWHKYAPDQFMDRVRAMKEQGALTHLSDEQASADILALCQKVAQMDAQRVYEQMSLNRPVEL